MVIESLDAFFARVRRDSRGSGTGERKDAGVSESFETFSAAIVHRWLPELAAATGRAEEDLQATGLHLAMFKTACVRVDFDDGSTMRFRHAFALRGSSDESLVGIFTEHCGHYEVELGMYDKLEVATPSSTEADIRDDRSDPHDQPTGGRAMMGSPERHRVAVESETSKLGQAGGRDRQAVIARLKIRTYLRFAPPKQPTLAGIGQFLQWRTRRTANGSDGVKRVRPALVRRYVANPLAWLRQRYTEIYAVRKGCRPVQILWLSATGEIGRTAGQGSHNSAAVRDALRPRVAVRPIERVRERQRRLNAIARLDAEMDHAQRHGEPASECFLDKCDAEAGIDR